MICDDLEPLIEGIADGTLTPSPEQAAHLAACGRCGGRLQEARSIDQWLSRREVLQPSPSFTAAVMARITQEEWKAERIVDLGFNLAIAAGVLVILAGAIGVAWSLGVFTFSIETDALAQMFGAAFEGRLASQVQTVVLAAALLTSALGLWWWAEAAD